MRVMACSTSATNSSAAAGSRSVYHCAARSYSARAAPESGAISLRPRLHTRPHLAQSHLAVDEQCAAGANLGEATVEFVSPCGLPGAQVQLVETGEEFVGELRALVGWEREGRVYRVNRVQSYSAL